jgi:peroxiredoxin
VSSLVTALSVAALGNFVLMVFIAPRQLPASRHAPQVGQRAPDFALPDVDGQRVSLSQLLSASPAGMPGTGRQRAPKGVLLIFYMYAGCRACNSEFREVQQNLGAFKSLGIMPVAISIDPPEVSRKLSNDAGYTFTFLSDPKLEVIHRYDVAKEDGEARPAEFLVDATGTVRWRNVTSNYYVRARPRTILDAARKLPLVPPPVQ